MPHCEQAFAHQNGPVANRQKDHDLSEVVFELWRVLLASMEVKDLNPYYFMILLGLIRYPDTYESNNLGDKKCNEVGDPLDCHRKEFPRKLR